MSLQKWAEPTQIGFETARPSDRVGFLGHGLTTLGPHFSQRPESAVIPINRLLGTQIITGTSGRRHASRGFSASTLATVKKNARM